LSEATACFVSIVVPVYNEADSLPRLYEEIAATMAESGATDYDIVLIDDGSTDASAEVLRGLHETDPEHVHVIVFRRNFGQSAAMAAGFDAARGDVIVPLDADLQNDPRDIPRLLEKLHEGYDVVSGWRADRQDPFWSRRVPSRVANALISWITGVRLHDYGCTLKAYHRDIVTHTRLYGEMHRFLPALASWRGARVAELPVNHRARQFGKSKYGIGRTLDVVLDLITIKFLLSYSTKPMRVFGHWALGAFAVGVFTGALSLALKVFHGEDITGSPWMYVSILFLLAGLQLMSMGLLGEINIRTYYESQGKTVYAVRETLGGARERSGAPGDS